ncbi:MAG TPA: ADOP family duplicated permease [Gemmatimonadaceae bacterium]
MRPRSDDTPSRRDARWFRLRFGRRSDLEAEVREELETHVAMWRDHLIAKGCAPNDAEREARARFGDYDAALRRLYSTAREREAQLNRRERIEDLRQDVRYAFRLFRRAPGFFWACVFTLAVGIGATGAVFSILRASLLEPLPYAAPDELVMVWMTPERVPAGSPGERLGYWRGYLTPRMVKDWQREPPAGLSDVELVVTWDGNLDAAFDLPLPDRTERLRGAFVTPGFFELLGVRAARGRVFTSSDDGTVDPAIVLSHALWQRVFGGDTGIVGRRISLTAGFPGLPSRAPRTFTVAGVLARDFRFTYPQETEVWAVMPWSALDNYSPDAITFQAVGRMAPGESLPVLRQRLTLLREGFDPANERPDFRMILRPEPIVDWVSAEVRPSLYLLGGVAGLLLLISGVTVANALLVRVSERRRELAVRTSLGAARGRLVRQLITEGALLSLVGAVAGTALAVALLPVLRAVLPTAVPLVGDVAVDRWVLGFAVATTAIITIIAATAPALVGTRLEHAATTLRAVSGASADRRTAGWRQLLVGTQAGVCAMLLVAAVLLLTSFWRLGRVPLGFEADQVVTAEMRLLDERFRRGDAAREARAQFQARLLERLRAIPGVTEVGLTSAVPFRGVDFYLTLSRVGEEESYGGRGRFVDAGFFQVLRVPLLRGRLFTESDGPGSPRVMVVSQAYAKKVFGDGDPIGQMMDVGGSVEIVGVVGDVRYEGYDREPREAIYLPRSQHPEALMCIVLRASVPPQQVIPAMQRAVHEVDPGVPVMQPTTIGRILDESVADRRFYTASTATFASIALLLTVVGLATIVARAVVERRRELAIRSALGASPAHLLSQATRSGLTAVAIGVAAGLAIAWWSAALLAQFLFQVEAQAAVTYLAIALLMLGVSAIAAWASARQLGRLPLARLLQADG